MSITTSIVDWVADTQLYYASKFRTRRKAPPYIAAELNDLGISESIWKDWSEEKRQGIASQISWIYSNIFRIGNEVSSANYNVFRKGTNEKDIDHPLERIMAFPNEFFSGKTLLQYLVWALSLDKWGAFWYLAPDNRTGELREIWPIPVGKMRPVKHKEKFISKYVYTARDGTKVNFRHENNCRFVYAHPFDIYKSKTPLDSSGLIMAVYQGITSAQKNMYTQNIGTPTSILSLDANISDPDFATARQRIRDDWASEPNRIAIVRAGSLDVKQVGLSSKDLEIVATQKFTRDEIDAIYMAGIQWRASASRDNREEINKEIKEAVIYPLHQMIAGQIQIQILEPWYKAEDFLGKFDDVRAQDRSILIQERNVYWRTTTVDEARAQLGLPAYSNKEFEGFGKLLVPLATDSSFVAQLYEIGPVVEEKEDPDDVGNLTDALDEERVVDDLAGDNDEPDKTIDIQAAVVDGIATELKRYKKVVIRDYRKHGDSAKIADRKFDTSIIPYDVMTTIKTNLALVTSEEDVVDIFSEWLR